MREGARTLAVWTDVLGAVEARFSTRREVAGPIVPDDLLEDALYRIADAAGHHGGSALKAFGAAEARILLDQCGQLGR